MTLKEFGALFRIPTNEPDLALAQFFASSRKIPLMYFLLTVNVWVLAIPFIGRAPDLLAIYVPIALTIVNLSRLMSWRNSGRHRATVETALVSLRRTNRLAPLIAVIYAGWCLSLFSFGDAERQGHIAFFMGVTVLSCVICMMHIRSAAVIVTIVMTSAFVVFFSATGQTIYIAEAINMASVAVAMLVIVGINYGDFRKLIASRKKLLAQRKELFKKQQETQKLSDENFRLANLDDLTCLPNRRYFFSELRRCHAQAEAGGSPFSVGLLDLNGFKTVNDMFGHAVGDHLLKDVAGRLRDMCGDHVFIARLGGDEFALLIKGERSPAELTACGLEIRLALAREFTFCEAEISVSAAVGFAGFETEVTEDGLYERADYALYQAKRHSSVGISVFGPQHHGQIQRKRKIERAFHLPQFEDEITLAFQPIVDSETQEILAFEALARWNSDSLGEVSPFEFIPVAENTGFIDTLTQILFRKAVATALTWPDHIGLSFNLSAKNITAGQSVARLREIIEESGIDPARIDFEITETAMLSDFDQARRSVDELKKCGASIALDDFGTGYSSLTHLHRLPLDKIKVDRAFVTNIGDNSASFDIVKSLISLARDMNIGCIIEGVETDLELRIVRDLGATMVQGYYVSKPLSAADARAFVRKYCCNGSDCALKACIA